MSQGNGLRNHYTVVSTVSLGLNSTCRKGSWVTFVEFCKVRCILDCSRVLGKDNWIRHFREFPLSRFRVPYTPKLSCKDHISLLFDTVYRRRRRWEEGSKKGVSGTTQIEKSSKGQFLSNI